MAIIYLLSVGPALKAAGHTVYFMASIPQSARFAQEAIQEIAARVVWCDTDHQMIEAMQSVPLTMIQHIMLIGAASLVKIIQNARNNVLKNTFHPEARFTASVYGSMQCMLKGVCAQCLQWQINPETGLRTKAVYTCSWQHQPLEIIDIEHAVNRANQNKMQEILTDLWVNHLLKKNAVERV
jgi:hypothetical protein